MANRFVGHVLANAGLVGQVDTTQRNPLGARVQTDDGNEWIYLAGVASCVEGDFVTYNTSAYVAVRLIASAVGMVAISPAAILAANWGWFMIKGFYATARAQSAGSVGAAGGVFATSAAAGTVDDSVLAANFVNGVVATGASAAGIVSVQISYPYVTATVPA